MVTDDSWAIPLVDAQRQSIIDALARDWDEVVRHVAALAGESPTSWGAAEVAMVHARELALLAAAQRIDEQLWQQRG